MQQFHLLSIDLPTLPKRALPQFLQWDKILSTRTALSTFGDFRVVSLTYCTYPFRSLELFLTEGSLDSSALYTYQLHLPLGDGDCV